MAERKVSPKTHKEKIELEFILSGKIYKSLDELIKDSNLKISAVQRYIKIFKKNKMIQERIRKGVKNKPIKEYRIFDPTGEYVPTFNKKEINQIWDQVIENNNVDISDTIKRKIQKILYLRDESRSEYKEIIKEINLAISSSRKLLFKKYQQRDKGLLQNEEISPVYYNYDEEKVYAYKFGSHSLVQYKFESMYDVTVSQNKSDDSSFQESEKDIRDPFGFSRNKQNEIYNVDIEFNAFVRSQLIRQFPQFKKMVKRVGTSTDKFTLVFDAFDIAPIGRFIFGLISEIKINNKQFKDHLKNYYKKYIEKGIKYYIS